MKKKLRVETIPTGSGTACRAAILEVEVDEHHERGGTYPTFNVEGRGSAMQLAVPLGEMGFRLARGCRYSVMVVVTERPRSRRRPRRNPWGAK